MAALQIYGVVLKQKTGYRAGLCDAHDQLETYQTKEAALLGVRQSLLDRSLDPNFVLDLTNAEPEEVAAYLK